MSAAAGTSGSPVIANNYASNPDISSDGRYVAFVSGADNLVSGDTNGEEDIFVFDRDNHTIDRVSVAGTSGSPIQHASESVSRPSISDDGRYVAFALDDDFGPSDTNGRGDVFVFDRSTHTLELASVTGTSGSPVQGDGSSGDPDISGDGRYVAFTSSADNFSALEVNSNDDIFVFDRNTHTLQRASEGGTSGSPVEGDGDSEDASISSDGRYVVFESEATNLVTGDTNSLDDIFVFDTQTHTTELVSRAGTVASPVYSNGNSRDAYISDNAECIVFESAATNFTTTDTNGEDDVFLVNGPAGTCLLIDDNDGADTATEDAAPNSGDANNDGTPDSAQATVTSLSNTVSGNYSVLAASACTANNAVAVSGETTDVTKDDDPFDYPAGLMNFTLTGCAVGGTETITQYHYGLAYSSLDQLVLRKYNSTDASYTTITSAVFTEQIIGGLTALVVTYQVTDGGPLDQDGTANGTIVDPAGPAVGVDVLAATGVGAYATPLIGAMLIAAVLQLTRITKLAARRQDSARFS